MVITSNMMALNAQRQLNMVGSSKKKSVEKLSSGYRINRAADDAAGLSISEKMRKQIRGLNQGSDNIQDGVSACQIMDGALAEVTDILHRITELSIKSANGTLAYEERAAIQREINQLSAELDRTSETAVFNDKKLLSAIGHSDTPTFYGGKADIVFVVDNTGSMDKHINNVKNNLNQFAAQLTECDTQYGFIGYGDTDSNPSIQTNYSFVGTADGVKEMMNTMKRTSGGDGPEQALEGIIAATQFPFREDATAKQVILVTDANYHKKGDGAAYKYTADDVRKELADKGIKLSVVTTAAFQNLYKDLANGKMLDLDSNFGDSLTDLAQGIAHSAQVIGPAKNRDLRIQCSSNVNDFITLHTYDITSTSLGLIGMDCLSQETAKEAIGKVDKACAYVSKVRSNIGAEQNRLEASYRNVANVAENTQSAESVIRDTDMAKEMIGLSLHNILEQSGTAMLAQANQVNQDVLSLLQ